MSKYIPKKQFDARFCRCFPHVVNISVQNILAKLESNPILPSLTLTSTEPEKHKALRRYADALKARPIHKIRRLVAACRASGQRRQDLTDAIRKGNQDHAWGLEGIPDLQLLRDCETRWSSTFNMVGRALTLYPVSKLFVSMK